MSNTDPSVQYASRVRGRPREFDMDAALDKAIKVFREQGYNATSIVDLTTAMELASGSIYKAFKDKRSVFLAAFDRYTALRSLQLQHVADTMKSGRNKLCDVLSFYVASASGTEGRRGCLVVGSAVELATSDPEIAARIAESLTGNEKFLASLIRQGQSDGSIPNSIDAMTTARVMVCLTQGMRVVGKSGRALPEASSVVDIAMKLLA